MRSVTSICIIALLASSTLAINASQSLLPIPAVCQSGPLPVFPASYDPLISNDTLVTFQALYAATAALPMFADEVPPRNASAAYNGTVGLARAYQTLSNQWWVAVQQLSYLVKSSKAVMDGATKGSAAAKRLYAQMLQNLSLPMPTIVSQLTAVNQTIGAIVEELDDLVQENARWNVAANQSWALLQAARSNFSSIEGMIVTQIEHANKTIKNITVRNATIAALLAEKAALEQTETANLRFLYNLEDAFQRTGVLAGRSIGSINSWLGDALQAIQFVTNALIPELTPILRVLRVGMVASQLNQTATECGRVFADACTFVYLAR